jgi:hypothetical protein
MVFITLSSSVRLGYVYDKAYSIFICLLLGIYLYLNPLFSYSACVSSLTWSHPLEHCVRMTSHNSPCLAIKVSPISVDLYNFASSLLLKDDRDIAAMIIKYLMTPVYYNDWFTRKCTEWAVQIITQLQAIQMPPICTFCVFTGILFSSIHKTCLHSID